MKTIGFVKSLKENENRIAIVPSDLAQIKHTNCIYLQDGYGKKLGYADEEYEALGCHIVSRDEALKQDIICDPKIGDAEYLGRLHNQTIFGWIHAVQNKQISDMIVENSLTGVAWEDMFENGRHSFWKNNEIAGEAAILHAYMLYGQVPKNTKVALIGRGNSAIGALRILNFFGADVEVYNRQSEALLRFNLDQYDVIVNAILWDTKRTDHIITKDDLKRMKHGAMIVDISCDRNGGIESCIPTTIENPTYKEEGIVHYCVDHTPSLLYKAISPAISEIVARFLVDLIEGNENFVLEGATIIKDGLIVDERIREYQSRK